ncbi:hypothetical protein J6590_016556 [Homalodisca vitripennis]|nr:hypothetical protein J6590_016556 [Homalodisca vitripennis]
MEESFRTLSLGIYLGYQYTPMRQVGTRCGAVPGGRPVAMLAHPPTRTILSNSKSLHKQHLHASFLRWTRLCISRRTGPARAVLS